MGKSRYAEDKPSDCRKCYFWSDKQEVCSLGENKCYYLLDIPEKAQSECDGCPYGRDHHCIGWCTRKILKEMKKTSNRLPKRQPFNSHLSSMNS